MPSKKIIASYTFNQSSRINTPSRAMLYTTGRDGRWDVRRSGYLPGVKSPSFTGIPATRRDNPADCRCIRPRTRCSARCRLPPQARYWYCTCLWSCKYTSLLFAFFRLHIGVHRLHVVKLFQAFHHLVDGLAVCRLHIFQVVGDG